MKLHRPDCSIAKRLISLHLQFRFMTLWRRGAATKSRWGCQEESGLLLWQLINVEDTHTHSFLNKTFPTQQLGDTHSSRHSSHLEGSPGRDTVSNEKKPFSKKKKDLASNQ